MKYPNARIQVFAKAPIVGHCKTRLIPVLGAAGAAELHARLVHHTLQKVINAQLCPVELWCADDPNHPFYRDCVDRYPIHLKQQQGNDLGQRMAHALNHALQYGDAALLIGCDCPSLKTTELDQALQALYRDNRCVLVPAHDGGYVLVGLNKPSDEIFTHIEWGSDQVMAQTRARLNAHRYHWLELPPHHDIDHPEDLPHLPARL